MPINSYSTYLKQLNFLYAKYGKLITDSKLQEFIDREQLEENFQITLADVKSDYMEIHCSEIRSKQKSEPIKYTTPNPKPVESKPKEENIPKCPICGSIDLSKITTAQKAGKAVLFGLFAAGDMSKTWKCNKCGSKF